MKSQGFVQHRRHVGHYRQLVRVLRSGSLVQHSPALDDRQVQRQEDAQIQLLGQLRRFAVSNFENVSSTF